MGRSGMVVAAGMSPPALTAGAAPAAICEGGGSYGDTPVPNAGTDLDGGDGRIGATEVNPPGARGATKNPGEDAVKGDGDDSYGFDPGIDELAESCENETTISRSPWALKVPQETLMRLSSGSNRSFRKFLQGHGRLLSKGESVDPRWERRTS